MNDLSVLQANKKVITRSRYSLNLEPNTYGAVHDLTRTYRQQASLYAILFTIIRIYLTAGRAQATKY